MLVSVTIRNIVLIEKINTSFNRGLCVLTGETGAGKSILLDALGLALGMRANTNLVRSSGYNKENLVRASVIASFELSTTHSIFSFLTDHNIEIPNAGEPLILRRNLDEDGRGSAFINDQAVSVKLLRLVGEQLVEIEGQFASQGLLNQATHREVLDKFSGLSHLRLEVRDLYNAWQNIESKLAKQILEQQQDHADQDYIRHSLSELQELDLKEGEEIQLSKLRSLLMNGERIVSAMTAVENSLFGGDGVEERLASAQRIISKESENTTGSLEPIMDALSIATDSVADAQGFINKILQEAAPDPEKLEVCEDRLFSIRALARKHQIPVEDLTSLRKEFEQRLQKFDDIGGLIKELEDERDQAHLLYQRKATILSEKRYQGARRLDKTVGKELPPLKLEKATFCTRIEPMPKENWGSNGMDHVCFEISTNPGNPSGPIGQTASGGELARLLLALKVVLIQTKTVPTLIFDEVDSGIGGAVAAAVGERLAKLAESTQVLTITHSPQVASYGTQHLQITKSEKKGIIKTEVAILSASERKEEIARMLAGTKITKEARAAAARLLDRDKP
ncbi:MAG: DNA repair protein RecN [Pseudomonadota bacterium]|nr:DNA repair protein RecN [Pseudomonadota bacterium]